MQSLKRTKQLLYVFQDQLTYQVVPLNTNHHLHLISLYQIHWQMKLRGMIDCLFYFSLYFYNILFEIETDTILDNVSCFN